MVGGFTHRGIVFTISNCNAYFAISKDNEHVKFKIAAEFGYAMTACMSRQLLKKAGSYPVIRKVRQNER